MSISTHYRRAGVVLTVIVGIVTAMSVTSAHATETGNVSPASAADCEGGRNGFVDIRDDLSGASSQHVKIGNRDVYLHLMFGTVKGDYRGWAYLTSGSYTTLSKNDSVWMDWSTDGGRTWLQCGPFYNPKQKYTITSAAKNTSSNPNYVFRAGMLTYDGKMYLTGWV